MKRRVGALWTFGTETKSKGALIKICAAKQRIRDYQHPHLKWYTISKKAPVSAKLICTSVYKEKHGGSE